MTQVFTAERPISAAELDQRPAVLGWVIDATTDDLKKEMATAHMVPVGKPKIRMSWVRPDKPGCPTAWKRTVRFRATARLVTMTWTGTAQ